MRVAAVLRVALLLAAASPMVTGAALPTGGDESSSSSSSSRGKSKSSSTTVESAAATDSSSVWEKTQPTVTATSVASNTGAPALVTTIVPSRTAGGVDPAATSGPLRDPAVIWPGADNWWVINAEKLVVGINASSVIAHAATPPLVDFYLDNPDTGLLNATLRINPGPITVLAFPFYYEAEIDLVARLKPGTGYTITVNGTGLSPHSYFTATSQPFEIKPKGSHITTPPGIGTVLYSGVAHAAPSLTLILGLLLVVLFHTA